MTCWCSQTREFQGFNSCLPRFRVRPRWWDFPPTEKRESFPERCRTILRDWNCSGSRVLAQVEDCVPWHEARKPSRCCRWSLENHRFRVREANSRQNIHSVWNARILSTGNNYEYWTQPRSGLVGTRHSHLRNACRLPTLLRPEPIRGLSANHSRTIRLPSLSVHKRSQADQRPPRVRSLQTSRLHGKRLWRRKDTRLVQRSRLAHG